MKLSLSVKSGSLAGKNWELSGDFLTIGRGASCNVMFDPFGERAVSANHAYIESKPDGFYLVDHNSSNGTYVNGERISRAKLKDRDLVQFGTNGPEATVFIETNNYSETQNAATAFMPAIDKQKFQVPQYQAGFQSPPVNWRNSVSNLGFGASQVKTAPSQTGKYIGLAIGIFTLVFLGLIVTLMIVGNLGIVAALIAAVIAFVPAVFYILPLMFLDRYDPEPLWALALAFAWGAIVAVLFSATANDLVDYAFGKTASGVISAPIFEEGSKGLGVVLILLFLRKEFDDILDGIVYAGTIALGFATVENVLYYGRGLLEGGTDLLFWLFIVRGIASPFAHVTFTAMTGIGCGISRESHKTPVRILMPLLGYVCAVALHALWNGMAFLGGRMGFFYGYILLEVPFFLLFVGFAGFVMYRQNKILKEMLAIDVARGLISAEQLGKVTSVFSGSFWVISSLFTEKFKARKRFLRAVGKLGLSYWHIQRATAAQGQTASFQQNPILREEVIKWRDKV